MIEEILKGFLVFILGYGMLYAVALLNIVVEEFIDTKSSFKKILFNRPLMILLSFLREKKTIKVQLIKLIPYLPLMFATTLLPDLIGNIYWDLDHSLWVFVCLMILSRFLYSINAIYFKEDFETNFIEKTLTGFIPTAIFTCMIIVATGTDKISEIIEYQNSHRSLIFIKPPLFFLTFVFWCFTTEYLSGRVLFSKLTSKRSIGLELYRTIWVCFIINQFILIPSVLLPLAIIALSFTGKLAFNFYFKFRNDQEEKFMLWEITPIALLGLIITLVIVGI